MVTGSRVERKKYQNNNKRSSNRNPKKKNNKPKLNGGPQKKGIVLRLRICTPRKPNSARRPAVKLKLTTKKRALAHIPGSGHNLRKFSKVLINGNSARDLPVVNYTCIRGVYDFAPLQNMLSSLKIIIQKPTGTL